MEDTDTKTNSQSFEGAESKGASQTQVGPIIGSAVIIIIIIIGGLYFIGKKVSEEGVFAPTAEEIRTTADPALQSLGTQGTSDEVSAIEEDLGTTDLNTLDAELQTIEQELNF